MDKIPYIAFESALARLERTNRRLYIVCILLLVMLLSTNAAWLYYEHQWETVEKTEVSQMVDTGDGVVTVIGIGDLNGEDSADR